MRAPLPVVRPNVMVHNSGAERCGEIDQQKGCSPIEVGPGSRVSSRVSSSKNRRDKSQAAGAGGKAQLPWTAGA
jgi:hypothetical protein